MCLNTSLAGAAASYKDNYDYLVGNDSDCARLSHLSGSVIMIALLIIGFIASAGGMPSQAVGWAALSLGGGYLVVKLLGGDMKARRVDLIAAAVIATLLIVCGSLAVADVFTGAHAGYFLVSLVGLTGCITVGMMIGAQKFCPRPKTF
jgi:hypothetical protein